MREREYHIVVLGSGGVGKSCLTAQFVQNVWIDSYDPTIEDSYRKQIEVDGRIVILEILDTAGTEQFTAMRELYMKTGRGFVFVFSITNASTLHELTDLYQTLCQMKPEGPRVPLVLVGNKSDMVEKRQVSRARAHAMAMSWGDKPYYETSARRRVNVDEVFKDVCRQIMKMDLEDGRGHRGGRGGGGGGYYGSGKGSELSEYDGGGRRRSDDYTRYVKGESSRSRRRRRRRSRKREGPSCTIL